MDKPFHLIEIVDHGIGFDQANTEKAFTLFTGLVEMLLPAG